ncbi:MAG: hypothetical protein H7123_02045 [Thermoleophilia bacterium]|nr:hypothetical protein [Thermoleophilia bacterium]
MKRVLYVLAFLAVALASVSSSIALGRGGSSGHSSDRVIKQGSCTGATSKLKLKRESGKRIEADFEVDQNRANQRWQVTMRHNNNVVFAGTRRTTTRSGALSVHVVLADRPGSDLVAVTARERSGKGHCAVSALAP